MNVDDLGTHSTQSTDYPDYAAAVGRGGGQRARPSAASWSAAPASAWRWPPTRCRACARRRCNDLFTVTAGARATTTPTCSTLGAREVARRRSPRRSSRPSSPPPFDGGRHERRVAKIAGPRRSADLERTARSRLPDVRPCGRRSRRSPRHPARARAPERRPRADRLGELRQPRGARGRRLACSPTSTPRATRASATTAAASSSTWSSGWRSSAPRQLFGAEHVNVQPHTGTSRQHGGLLRRRSSRATRCWAWTSRAAATSPTATGCPTPGRDFKVVAYGVDRTSERIDYDEVARAGAREHRPKLIVCGATRLQPGDRLRALPRHRRRGRARC